MKTILVIVSVLALAAADACARARGGHEVGNGELDGKGDKDTAAPGPEMPSAPEAQGSAHEGPDTRGDSSRRQFCMRWPTDYWCQEGPPFIAPPKR